MIIIKSKKVPKILEFTGFPALFMCIDYKIKKADKGNRTPLSSLGSWRSTDEPYLHDDIITPGEGKVQKFFIWFKRSG